MKIIFKLQPYLKLFIWFMELDGSATRPTLALQTKFRD